MQRHYDTENKSRYVHLNLISHASMRATNGIEFLGLTGSQSKGVETVHTHILQVTPSGHVEADNDDEVSKDENGALEIITLSFPVDVREEENAENYGDHIPLWENETGK